MKLPVKEQFISYQGTGVNTGVRQSFVRLSGCSVPCPLRANCDQPEALKHTLTNQLTIDEILTNAKGSEWLHITGGEPAEHEHIRELCDCAKSSGFRVQVQTSGSLYVDWSDDVFVSISPKQRGIMVTPSEVVLVACKWMTDEFALKVTHNMQCPVFVIPEAFNGNFICRPMLELVKLLHKHGRNVRPGLQAHLIWEVR